jgi:hypothetical protein
MSVAPAGAQTPPTNYSAAAPTLDSITSPSSCTTQSTSTCAPWNEWQGDPGTSASPNQTDAQNCAGTVTTGYGSGCLLFPSYNPTGGPTTTTNNGAGGASITEPNLSVSPGAASGTDGVAPYPSGVVGTPGPLDAYCGSGTEATESTQSVSRMTPGTTLPLAPAYFPHVVRNADGSLTGYFDYRPKDADEALVAATSTDGGVDWTYDGEALEQNPGYCPSADTNDDGQGHANIVTLANGNTFLYTLPRAAGDAQGVGLDIHQFNPTAANPLGSGAQALPAAEETGVDPDTFATAGASVLTTGGATIAVTQTGSANSPQQLVTGGFVDLSQDAVPNPNEVINCTVSSYNALGGCTSATPITVNQGDLIEQVIGYVSAQTGTATIPTGPNTSNGDGGLGTIDVSPSASTATATSGSSNLGFTSPLIGSTLNANAPNRVYVDGVTAYCAQSNNNPTTKIENCTSGPSGAPLPLSAGMIITSDPIIPSTAYASDPASGGMTTGLVAPDGIVGVLPSYPGVPSGATAIMYTEKELNYYLAGDSTNAVTLSSSSGATIDFIASPYIAENMPSPSTVTSTNPVQVTMGLTTTSKNSTGAMVTVTCTSLTDAGAASTLGGCTIPSSDTADIFEQAKTYVGAPGAATVALSTLAQQGEGSSSNVVKLYKNNEDVSILRVAYTTDGSTFSYAGLPNDGIVSDCVSSSSTVTLQNQTVDPGVPEVGCTGSYQGVNNPDQQNNPPNGLNSYATNEGTPGGSNGTDTGGVSGGDATEMRWVGSAGSIITNPNGTYGLFLSGAWAADGDSDAFNQVFYSEGTTSTNGQGQSTITWSVPTPVISTDYSFSASYNQDNNVNGDGSQPVGISAYYEGRAYGPSVVQNPNGTLTMVFAGYRFPKSIVSAGSVLGDQASSGSTGGTASPTWTVGPNDLNMYRNILTTTLSQSTSPAVATTTSVSASPSPATFGQTEVLSATVAPVAPGTGTPTGEVTFTGSGGATLCTAALDQSSSDTATCNYPYTAPTTDSVSASYAGDSNYASSASTTPASVTINQATPSTPTISNLPASGVYGGGFTATVSTNGDGTPSVTSNSDSVCTVSDLVVSYVGVGQCSLTAHVSQGTDYTAADGTPQSFQVSQGAPTTPTISNLPGSGTFGGGFTAQVSTDGDGATSVTSSTTDVCTASGLSVSYVGVGPCTLTAHVAAGTNYGAADGTPQTFTVSPATYTVTVTGSQTYGGSPTFTANPSSGPTEPYSGTVSCTTVNGGTSISPSLSASGSYTIDGSSCSGLSLQGSDANDYTIAYSGSTFAVNSAIYTVDVTGSQTYGGSPTFTANPTSGPTEPYSGTLVCSTVNGGSRLSTLNAGSYTIDGSSCSGLSLTGADAGNYQIAYVGQGFTVSQAVWPVTVTGSQTYGGSPTFTARPTSGPTKPYKGSVTCTTVNGGTAISPTLPVGSGYTIDSASCSGLILQGSDATNYTVAYSGGAFSVTGTSTTKVTVTKSGSTATITAKVKGTPAGFAVTGTVTFVPTNKHGVVVKCKRGSVAALNSSAQATCTLSGLTAANSPYSVSVRYSGDADYGPSVSATKKFTG